MESNSKDKSFKKEDIDVGAGIKNSITVSIVDMDDGSTYMLEGSAIVGVIVYDQKSDNQSNKSYVIMAGAWSIGTCLSSLKYLDDIRKKIIEMFPDAEMILKLQGSFMSTEEVVADESKEIL